MWGDENNGGDGSAASPIMVGGDPSLQLTNMPQRKKKWQSFLGGMQPNQQGQGGGMLGGLSTLAGTGGFAGGVGNVAKFLL